ncbi:outer membrane protein/peptidoglycan-associated (lipo)protein [Aurantimonas sp. 22II-16-19i]|nr:outer membrane protein/peptidoglycan-associated (lipo)protein [Aurantimonas sp. 22II-16-19i]
MPSDKPGQDEPGTPVPEAAPANGDAAPAEAPAPAEARPGAEQRPGERGADRPRRGQRDGDRDGAERPGEPAAERPAEGQPVPAEAPQGAEDEAPDEAAERPAERPQPVPAATQNEPVAPDGIDASDARVQQLAEPVEIAPITEEQGERIEAPRRGGRDRDGRDRDGRGENGRDADARGGDRDREAGDRRGRGDGDRPNVEVVRRDDDGRQILSIIGAGVAGAVAGGAAAYFIKGDDRERLTRNAEETYYERLPRGRTRQTIVRDNGVQIVTVTDSYGDILRRSRVMPDGREVVLFYDPYEQNDRRPRYDRDPGRDLPELTIGIPRDEYIVDIDQPDEAVYLRTLVAPPVETVERIYSVDEVVRSERIRDKVRRIDLNTINFDFGSAAIAQNQVGNLEALADAVKEVVDKNPGETFLIEGHTDAVGSEISNLALSDKRAESVASALTEYFDVPPENLVTQGYGEGYLKVDTEGENRENRRVTVRRITPLVKPVQTSGN